MATKHTAPVARPSLPRPAFTVSDAELVAAVDCALGMLIVWQAQRFDAAAAARATRASAHQLCVAPGTSRRYLSASERNAATAKRNAALLGLDGPTHAQRRAVAS